MNELTINKVAILGAGVMGAQVAAHFANVGIPVLLFDLADASEPNGIVKQSLNALSKLNPSPLAYPEILQRITACNYEQDLEKLQQCDFVLEAIAEQLSWKQDLYAKIKPHFNEQAVFASNTSGLSISTLADSFSAEQQQRFLGVHFFNPPRYMPLVEFIPHSTTNPELLDSLEAFFTSRLGKGVVRAKDTPNFIGNRVGVFAILALLHHAQECGLAPDLVDALTGPLIGRPKSATYRTLDVVGLDTFAHVVDTMQKGLPNDPWHDYFKLPDWILELINKGALGSKTKTGIYKKADGKINVLDIKQGHYRPSHAKPSAEVIENLKGKSPAEQFAWMSQSDHIEAQFMWRCFRDLFHYCAVHLDEIAHSMRDVDLAMRWGYGWQMGPFELWRQAGWQEIRDAIQTDINKKQTLVNAPLPDWALKDEPESSKIGKANEQLSVYGRQYFPDRVFGELAPPTRTVFETNAVECWTLIPEVYVLSFKTKKNTVNLDVLDGVMEAVKRAETDQKALILWQKYDQDFSFGANLAEVLVALEAQQQDAIHQTIAKFQQASMALKYAKIPTIAAIRGRTLGGGCELTMHCRHKIAAFETYIGLVEVGVGLIPAGGGTKEFALRAARETRKNDLNDRIQYYFEVMGNAKLAQSGFEAQRIGYLQPHDSVIINSHEILHVAHQQALAMLASSYQPLLPEKFPVVGVDGEANVLAFLANMREGHFISDHDYLIGSKLAHVMSGGGVPAGSFVDEQWLLNLELQVFMELLQTKATQERIQYTLKNGKPLRN